MLDTSVKWFSSTNVNAPALVNSWGDIVSVLDACLINGFGDIVIISGTISVANNTVTLVTNSDHKLKQYQVVELSGFDQPFMNNQFKILKIESNTSFTVELPSDYVNEPLSGLMTAKLAPLDWEKPFSATHRGAYRSKDTRSNQRYLLVDNRSKANQGFGDYNTNWAKWANVGIVEDLVDLDTIVGMQAPYDAANPNKNWKQTSNTRFGWAKWYSSMGNYENNPGTNLNMSWVLVGDGSLFYFIPQINGVWARALYCFGDINNTFGNPFSTILAAHTGIGDTNLYVSYPGQYGGSSLNGTSYSEGIVTLRNHTGLGTHQVCYLSSVLLNNSTFNQHNSQNAIPFPNGYTSNVLFFPVYLTQADCHLVGVMPGLRLNTQRLNANDMTVVDLDSSEAVLLVNSAAPNTNTTVNTPFYIKNSWR